jgi:hypothetical protein
MFSFYFMFLIIYFLYTLVEDMNLIFLAKDNLLKCAFEFEVLQFTFTVVANSMGYSLAV